MRMQKFENFAKIRPNLAIFHHKIVFFSNYAGTDSAYKNHARKLKFGRKVPLYGLHKALEQIFQFLIFFENMDDYVQNFGHFGHFVRIFGHILKKIKN